MELVWYVRPAMRLDVAYVVSEACPHFSWAAYPRPPSAMQVAATLLLSTMTSSEQHGAACSFVRAVVPQICSQGPTARDQRKYLPSTPRFHHALLRNITALHRWSCIPHPLHCVSIPSPAYARCFPPIPCTCLPPAPPTKAIHPVRCCPGCKPCSLLPGL